MILHDESGSSSLDASEDVDVLIGYGSHTAAQYSSLDERNFSSDQKTKSGATLGCDASDMIAQLKVFTQFYSEISAFIDVLERSTT